MSNIISFNLGREDILPDFTLAVILCPVEHLHFGGSKALIGESLLITDYPDMILQTYSNPILVAIGII